MGYLQPASGADLTGEDRLIFGSHLHCAASNRLRLKTGTSIYEYQFILCDCEEDVARATLFGVVIPFAAFQLVKGIFRHTCERIVSLFEDRSEEEQVVIMFQIYIVS